MFRTTVGTPQTLYMSEISIIVARNVSTFVSFITKKLDTLLGVMGSKVT